MKTALFSLIILTVVLILTNTTFAEEGQIIAIRITTAENEYVIDDGDQIEIPEGEINNYTVRIEIDPNIGQPRFMYNLSHNHGYDSGIQVTPDRFIEFGNRSGAHTYRAAVDERIGGSVWSFQIADDINEEPPIIRIEPRRFDYGDIVVGQIGEQNFTIFNDGGSELIIFRMRYPNGGERSLYVDGGNLENFRIPAHERHVINLIFEPLVASDAGFWVPLVFVCNYPDRPNYETFIGGRGIEGDPGNPVVENPIDDFITDEDSGLREIADLDNVFSDPDGDALDYEVTDVVEQLNIEINEENILTVNADENYNSPEGVVVEITASDQNENSTSESFTVIINSVNDLPQQFELLTPVDGYEMPFDQDMQDIIYFSWEEAAQNEYEIDMVAYTIYFECGNGENFNSGPYFSLSCEDLSLQFLIESLDISGEIVESVKWWVVARDESEIGIESLDRSVFGVPALGVKPKSGDMLPNDLSISANYPNPFNSSTTINFSLPYLSFAELSVLDLSGKQVAMITTGKYHSGNHFATWNADEFTAGTYIIRLRSEHRNKFRLITLLK